MTINTSWYTMDNKIGVNLNRVISSVTITANPSQPEYPGIPHNLGDRVQGNDGSEWMFVQASATITCFNAVAIDANNKAENITIGHVTATAVGFVYGLAQFQVRGSVSVGNANGGCVNAGDFFWALIKANNGARVNLATAAPSGGASGLYIAASSNGTFLTAGSVKMNGIYAVATAGGGASAAEVQFFSYMMPSEKVSALAVSV